MKFTIRLTSTNLQDMGFGSLNAVPILDELTCRAIASSLLHEGLHISHAYSRELMWSGGRVLERRLEIIAEKRSPEWTGPGNTAPGPAEERVEETISLRSNARLLRELVNSPSLNPISQNGLSTVDPLPRLETYWLDPEVLSPNCIFCGERQDPERLGLFGTSACLCMPFRTQTDRRSGSMDTNRRRSYS